MAEEKTQIEINREQQEVERKRRSAERKAGGRKGKQFVANTPKARVTFKKTK